uniref:NADH-ubiquinone oxidoreductase chain 4 n=1 Tax=Agamermis sp. BH-2006 TaxID=390897 RepID=Q0Z874_9BILA|nr:NADH dehydrogenase subunit 4 [Agamermis sp. BH-2006]ABG38300.1 NADH dehydrogenase subunit 4 [Agamermis sp. BH-2006]
MLCKILMFSTILIVFNLYSWFENFAILMILSVSLVWISLNFMKMYFKTSIILMNFMWMLMLIFFMTNTIWKFYILFEMNMIPMVLIIMSWGSNMARINSSIYMMLYTFFFSLPVLVIIMNNLKFMGFSSLDLNNHYLNNIFNFMLILMFMVKIPVFGLHYWLPKAHVEASTMGSMILASGLLKTGSFGFFKTLLWNSAILNYSWMLIGFVFSSLYCCMQSDQKKLIALSSVSHMSLACCSLLSFSNIGMFGMIILNFTHSIISSFLFLNSGIFSSFSKMRLFKYLPKTSFHNIILLVVSIILNLGLPPALSFISEITCMAGVFMNNLLSAIMIFIAMILSLFFSYIYIFFSNQSFISNCFYINNKLLFMFLIHFTLMMFWFSIF